MGAGVRGFEAFEAAKARGFRVVGGNCPTVGLAGGFIQGGGHSTLSSLYGLGADQTLEWEVVTADGKHVIASPARNSDLYWALSGGGGGTYGVVLSVTVRAHKDGVVGGASLFFPSAGISNDTFWDLVAFWQRGLSKIVDTGATAIHSISKAGFTLLPVTAPGLSVADMTAMLRPFTTELEKHNVTYDLNITSFPNFRDHYEEYLGPLPFGKYPGAQLIGGRLIPRSVVADNNDGLVAAMRNITENSNFFLGCIGLNVSQPSGSPGIPSNAVLPGWRDAIMSILVIETWNFSLPRAVSEAEGDELTNNVVPQLADLSPGAGAYMSEADFQLPTWKEDFYGSNYERLRAIKTKYDPDDLFYGQTAVGSDVWTAAGDGRLCRT